MCFITGFSLGLEHHALYEALSLPHIPILTVKKPVSYKLLKLQSNSCRSIKCSKSSILMLLIQSIWYQLPVVKYLRNKRVLPQYIKHFLIHWKRQSGPSCFFLQCTSNEGVYSFYNSMKLCRYFFCSNGKPSGQLPKIDFHLSTILYFQYTVLYITSIAN